MRKFRVSTMKIEPVARMVMNSVIIRRLSAGVLCPEACLEQVTESTVFNHAPYKSGYSVSCPFGHLYIHYTAMVTTVSHTQSWTSVATSSARYYRRYFFSSARASAATIQN